MKDNQSMRDRLNMEEEKKKVGLKIEEWVEDKGGEKGEG